MNINTSGERLGQTLAGHQEHLLGKLKAAEMARQSGHERPIPAAVTIAISRQDGADGTAVARKIGEHLGWQVYDSELLRRIADEMGLRTRLLESIDEKGQSWLMVYLQSSTPGHSVSAGAYVYELTKVALSLAAHGECVIVGRGAALFLPPEKTLRVRLVAPREHRIATAQERYGLARDAAARRIDETDAARDRFMQDSFHKDPTDPTNYDLVLNTARFGVDRSAELIEQAVRQLERG
jgi:cytidylate kinase